jgi:nucleotide-binding universal stress UspA family protein
VSSSAAAAPIVVGVDPSDTGGLPDRAAELARVLGTPVHIVSASYRPRFGRERLTENGLRVSGNARADPQLCAALGAAAEPFQRLGVEVVLHARSGDPAEAIVTIAEEQNARMIVVGSRGMRGARRYLLGDVPNKVSHHAPCGVMILKTAEHHPDRGTKMLAGLALAGLGTITAEELVRLRRRSRPVSGREPLDVAVAGYRSGSSGERALLLLFASFVATSAISRWNTWSLHRGGRFVLLPEVVRGRRHIHHFVPGIAAAFLSGAGSLVLDARHREWLAVPFGAGAALTLDEWALLLELSDVYWSEEGIVSLQVMLGTTTLLASLTLLQRLLRRGERRLPRRVVPTPGRRTRFAKRPAPRRARRTARRAGP